jgi:hypothetical protein
MPKIESKYIDISNANMKSFSTTPFSNFNFSVDLSKK